MFALVKNQTGRPDQPLAAVSADELAQCVASVNGRWQSSDVHLLTYLTDVSAAGPWALGFSAAYHGQPLIVQGLGMRWRAVGIKLPAARRAAQLGSGAAAGLSSSSISTSLRSSWRSQRRQHDAKLRSYSWSVV